MLALLLAPAFLSSLVLAAHFLRRGAVLPFLACLALAACTFVRLPWARRTLQGGLALGVLVWTFTLYGIMRERMAEDLPWQKTAIILGIVAAVDVLAALLLEQRRAVAHFAGPAASAGEASANNTPTGL